MINCTPLSITSHFWLVWWILICYFIINVTFTYRRIGGCARFGLLSNNINFQLWQYNAFGAVNKLKNSFVDLNKYGLFTFLLFWKGKMHQQLFQLIFIFNNLFQEASEAGALRLAKTKLEKQLEELTWRLHLEKKLRVLLRKKIWSVLAHHILLLPPTFYWVSLMLIPWLYFFRNSNDLN